MNENLNAVEFMDNPEPRCPCVLLLDVSSSMHGDRINALNDGLQQFQDELVKDDLAKKRVEVAIVTFGGKVAVAQDFVTVDEFRPPILETFGDTPMGAAIRKALDMLRDRKETYKQNGIAYYRPWIFLITDGAPTDEWQSAAQRIKQEENGKKVTFFSVGVEDADMSVLSQISVRQPLKLKGLQFTEMFIWLSKSMQSVSQSKMDEKVPLQTPLGWGNA
jgi:uncharacterized protein YegL